jgi:hypothetical protein
MPYSSQLPIAGRPAIIDPAMLPQQRPNLAELLAGLSPLFERMLWGKAVELLPLQLRDLLPFGDRFGHPLPMHFGQLWLVIECIQVAHPTRHIKPDDPLGTGSQMEWLDHPATDRIGWG